MEFYISPGKARAVTPGTLSHTVLRAGGIPLPVLDWLISASLLPGVSPLTFVMGAPIPVGCPARKGHVGHQMLV